MTDLTGRALDAQVHQAVFGKCAHIRRAHPDGRNSEDGGEVCLDCGEASYALAGPPRYTADARETLRVVAALNVRGLLLELGQEPVAGGFVMYARFLADGVPAGSARAESFGDAVCRAAVQALAAA